MTPFISFLNHPFPYLSKASPPRSARPSLLSRSLKALLLCGAFLLQTHLFANNHSKAGALILVSVPPMQYLIDQLNDGSFKTESIFSAKDDPHEFTLPPSKIRKLAKAKLYFSVGLESEPFMQKKISAINAEVQFVRLSPTDDEHEEGHHDEDHHDHEEKEHSEKKSKHESKHDHDGLAHACKHFNDAPVAVRTGGALPKDHTRYRITLANGTAAITLERAAAGAVALFLGSKVPITLTDKAGKTQAPLKTMTGGAECPGIATAAVFKLKSGRHTLTLGPAAKRLTVDVVWEKASLEEEEMHSEAGEHGHDEHGHSDHDHIDRHYWMSPIFMKTMAQQAFSAMQPLAANPQALEKKLTRLLKKLDDLDKKLKKTLRDSKGKTVFTYHPAYKHFAERYEIKEFSLLRGHEQFRPSQLRRFSAEIREKKAKAIFIQPNFTGKKIVTPLARDLQLQLLSLAPLSYNYSANLLRTARLFAKYAR